MNSSPACGGLLSPSICTASDGPASEQSPATFRMILTCRVERVKNDAMKTGALKTGAMKNGAANLWVIILETGICARGGGGKRHDQTGGLIPAALLSHRA